MQLGKDTQFRLTNISEEAVKRELRLVWDKVEICQCEKCFYDVCAIALNNVPPYYATTPVGEVLSNTAVLVPEFKHIMLVELTKAISKVRENPQH